MIRAPLAAQSDHLRTAVAGEQDAAREGQRGR